ncbi:baculoviral IAP repeat-containing protein 8, partial [Biomphalaria glabrata]
EKEENAELLKKVTCKICYQQRLKIIFLPCGHLISCYICADRLVRCPLCRHTIQEKIEVIMTSFNEG